jgi:uncharacterized OB-fold protein
MADRVIPLDMIPDKESFVETKDRKRYLVTNEAMYTFFRRSKGELSPFFLNIKEKKRLTGCKCTKCGILRVPPFLEKCPECNFAPTRLVQVPDTGKMLSTPPITYFAHSLFQDMAPFGRGRVVLGDSATAVPMFVYTTQGVLRPGIFKKGTPVKVVFRDEREGSPRDMFAVPISELTPQQVKKKGLTESELDWSSPREPRLSKNAEAEKSFDKVLKELDLMSKKIKKSKRARSDLSGWKRRITVKTAGGNFGIVIADGGLEVIPGAAKRPNLTMVCEDPRLFSAWMNSAEALTNAIIAGRLWINKNAEFKTVFKLDRLPRSLRRSK